MDKVFSDIDFIRLFCACMYVNGRVIFDKDSLRYDLYSFKYDDKYAVLFQDISVKQEIEGSYLDIENVLHEADFRGFIALSNNINNHKSIIFMDEDYVKVIINKYDSNYAMLMDDLVKKYLSNDKSKKFIKILN